MILGFLLFYFGAVLFLNGLWLMARIQDREIVVINVVAGRSEAAHVLEDLGFFVIDNLPPVKRTHT